MNNTKKLVIIAQVFISGIMALLMSLVHMGFTLDWLWIWSTTFVVAWPVAFRPVDVRRAGQLQDGHLCPDPFFTVLRPTKAAGTVIPAVQRLASSLFGCISKMPVATTLIR